MACASCCVLCVSRYWKLAAAATFFGSSSLSRRYVVVIFNEVTLCQEASKHEASSVVWVFCANDECTLHCESRRIRLKEQQIVKLMKWHYEMTFHPWRSFHIFWCEYCLFFECVRNFFWFVISSLRSLLVVWLQLHRHFVSLFCDI